MYIYIFLNRIVPILIETLITVATPKTVDASALGSLPWWWVWRFDSHWCRHCSVDHVVRPKENRVRTNHPVQTEGWTPARGTASWGEKKPFSPCGGSCVRVSERLRRGLMDVGSVSRNRKIVQKETMCCCAKCCTSGQRFSLRVR